MIFQWTFGPLKSMYYFGRPPLPPLTRTYILYGWFLTVNLPMLPCVHTVQSSTQEQKIANKSVEYFLSFTPMAMLYIFTPLSSTWEYIYSSCEGKKVINSWALFISLKEVSDSPSIMDVEWGRQTSCEPIHHTILNRFFEESRKMRSYNVRSNRHLILKRSGVILLVRFGTHTIRVGNFLAQVMVAIREEGHVHLIFSL